MEDKTSTVLPEKYKISTIGYLGQHFERVLRTDQRIDSYELRQTIFCQTLAEYGFSKDDLKTFIKLAQTEINERTLEKYKSKIDKSTNTQSKQACYRTIFAYHSDQIKMFTETVRNNDYERLNESHHEYIMEDSNQFDEGAIVYYLANPVDSALLIDSSPAIRKLAILEEKVKNLPDMIPEQVSSFSEIAQRQPTSTPSKKPKAIVPARRQAAKIIAGKGTSLETIKEICSKHIGNFECSFDTLKETQTANFRIVCEKVPVNQDLSKLVFWKNSGLLVRLWSSVIQDLNKRTRIRRLISGLDAFNPNSQVNYIKQRISSMYTNNETINIQMFNFKNQSSTTKNYVIEIESTTDQNVHDHITDYCTSRYIKIRPWKGKLPESAKKSLPTFD